MEYYTEAFDALIKGFILLNANDWVLEKRSADGATIHSKALGGGDKVFKLTVAIEAAPRRVLDSILFGSQHWDTDLAHSRLHQVGAAQTDVSEQEVQIGGVTRRSVLSARTWMSLGACWLAAATPTSTAPALPSHTPSRLTRALVWSCWLVCPADGGSQLQWLLRSDPKLMVPFAMVHAATPAAMLRYASSLRSYLHTATLLHCSQQPAAAQQAT